MSEKEQRGVLSPEEAKKALKDFLLDEKLNEIKKYSSEGFNVFDVLKSSRTEIRHSNVLAWLIDPSESHGMGESILRKINEKLARDKIISDDRVFDILTMDYSDIMVHRETHNIDLLIVSDASKYVLCIENKIDSVDHSGQLDKYYGIIEKNYDDKYVKIYLYLTPEGEQPLEDENQNWACISYKDVLEIIEKELEDGKGIEEANPFIENYLSVLRREIVENKKIAEICQKIYKEHKSALDLIYDYRPDSLQNFSVILKEWCKEKEKEGHIKFNDYEEKSLKTNIYFRSEIMDSLIHESKNESVWGTCRHYFYLIKTWISRGEGKNRDIDIIINYKIQLLLNSQKATDEEKEQLEEIDDLFNNKGRKETWQWRTSYTTDKKWIIESEFLDAEDDSYEKIEKDIKDNLNKMLEKVKEKEKEIKKNKEEREKEQSVE